MKEPDYKTVGYLGPDYTTFGFMAVEKYFGNCYEPRAFDDHRAICEAVGTQEIDYGVIAIENMIDGAIADSVTAIEDTQAKLGVHVFGEVIIPVELFYLRKNKSNIPPRILKSHQSAIRQCSKFVAQLQDQGIRIEASASTGEAALEASEDSDIAALGNINAQEKFNLVRLQEDSVEDLQDNQTRFWVISQSMHKKTGKDKTSFLINLDHDGVGGLQKALSFFSSRNICLLWLYANPIPGRHWEYTFLVEFQGHITDQAMNDATRELRESGLSLNPSSVIGSYPVAYQRKS